MSTEKTPHYTAGVPCWVDALQHDPNAAVEFYGKLLGWTFVGPAQTPHGGKYFVAQLNRRDVAGVLSMPPGTPQPCWSTYVLVDDLQEACRRVRDAGGMLLVAPTGVPPAGAFAVLRDPTGGIMGMWQAQERVGAHVVNQANAWTMNQLTTPDTERAAKFYNAVFGWEIETLGEGDALFLFRLPNYVGGLPQQPVPRDVVAVMMESRGSTGGGAFWSVDFRVSDVDRTGHRAEELGGTLSVPPFNTPFSRNAVLMDPQGAAFSIHAI